MQERVPAGANQWPLFFIKLKKQREQATSHHTHTHATTHTHNSPDNKTPSTTSNFMHFSTLVFLLLLSSLARAQQSHIKVSCDALPELNAYLAWVRVACEQTHETFADPFVQLPSTCASPGCAAAVHRFDVDCSGFLAAHGAAFSGYVAQLRTARSACAAGRGASNAAAEHAVQPYPYPVTTSCSGVLTDGAGNYGPGWDRRAILDAGPGRKVVLSFTVLVLASVAGGGAGDFIEIFDGPSVAGVWRDHRMGAPLRLNARPAGALTSSGQYLRVRFVSDSASVGASGFSASIACVCEDSAEWVDAAGRHCAQYGGGGLACSFGAASPPQGSVPSTGLVLSAEEACPLACGSCATPEPEPEPETDPCASAPCQHGGTCSVSDGPGGGHRRVQDGQCTLAQFNAQAPALNSVCCTDPGESCSEGMPASCDAECAAVFLPLVDSCGNVLSQFLEPKAQQSLVAQCQASRGLAATGSYRCTCASGWSGENCATGVAPSHVCASRPCQNGGTCSVAQCHHSYTGPTCTFAPSYRFSGTVHDASDFAGFTGEYVRTSKYINGAPIYELSGHGFLWRRANVRTTARDPQRLRSGSKTVWTIGGGSYSDRHATDTEQGYVYFDDGGGPGPSHRGCPSSPDGCGSSWREWKPTSSTDPDSNLMQSNPTLRMTAIPGMAAIPGPEFSCICASGWKGITCEESDQPTPVHRVLPCCDTTWCPMNGCRTGCCGYDSRLGGGGCGGCCYNRNYGGSGCNSACDGSC
jgi:hypothetical protein